MIPNNLFNEIISEVYAERLLSYFNTVTAIFKKVLKERDTHKMIAISLILAQNGKAEFEPKLENNNLTRQRVKKNLDKLHIQKHHDGYSLEWKQGRTRMPISSIEELIKLLNDDNTNTALKNSKPT